MRTIILIATIARVLTNDVFFLTYTIKRDNEFRYTLLYIAISNGVKETYFGYYLSRYLRIETKNL